MVPHFINEAKINDSFEKENRFVYIGRLSAEKQIDHILRAYKIFIDKGFNTKLVLFGHDESNQKEMLKNLARQLEIEEKVEIHDFTNNPLLEFQKSKASLLSSSFEGFGLSVMESINVGCPVISYNVNYGPSEIITHGENGYLVEPNNISELAKYMEKIIQNPLPKVKTKSELKYNTAINNYKKLFKSLEN